MSDKSERYTVTAETYRQTRSRALKQDEKPIKFGDACGHSDKYILSSCLLCERSPTELSTPEITVTIAHIKSSQSSSAVVW
jgi:hypothetical protein